jgi:hypothetical protein
MSSEYEEVRQILRTLHPRIAAVQGHVQFRYLKLVYFVILLYLT